MRVVMMMWHFTDNYFHKDNKPGAGMVIARLMSNGSKKTCKKKEESDPVKQTGRRISGTLTTVFPYRV